MTSETQNIEFKIPTQSLFPTFKEHLDTENNSRILFSGNFGIGKTYFLNDFFAEHKNEYECFHLFPVNYQISQNEDIVNFLKYDILTELVKKNENILQGEDFLSLLDYQQVFYLWGKENIGEIFKTTLGIIPKIGKPLKDVVSLMENFWEYKKEIEAGDEQQIKDFLKQVKTKKISETDTLSEILKDKIKKQRGDNKQSVLILDDLDRVDPEHIFRLLNVFSAHFDLKNGELPNKFGFDKIILVGDVRNLKSIFHHRYGEQTDSNGYFDKFFSMEVFEFRNEELIEKSIREIFSKYLIEDQTQLEALSRGTNLVEMIVKDLLIKSVNLTTSNKLNLRQLLKGVKIELTPLRQNGSYHDYHFFDDGEQKGYKYALKASIQLLISIFGGVENDLILTLQDVKKAYSTDETRSLHIYQQFAYHLLSLFKDFSKPEYQSPSKIPWKNYSISLNRQDQNIGSVCFYDQNGKISPATFSNLYFDLLLEYVNQGLYLRRL